MCIGSIQPNQHGYAIKSEHAQLPLCPTIRCHQCTVVCCSISAHGVQGTDTGHSRMHCKACAASDTVPKQQATALRHDSICVTAHTETAGSTHAASAGAHGCASARTFCNAHTHLATLLILAAVQEQHRGAPNNKANNCPVEAARALLHRLDRHTHTKALFLP